MRLFIVPILAILFTGWILYHWLIKKDIRKHKNDIIGGIMALAASALMYVWVFL